MVTNLRNFVLSLHAPIALVHIRLTFVTLNVVRMCIYVLLPIWKLYFLPVGCRAMLNPRADVRRGRCWPWPIAPSRPLKRIPSSGHQFKISQKCRCSRGMPPKCWGGFGGVLRAFLWDLGGFLCSGEGKGTAAKRERKGKGKDVGNGRKDTEEKVRNDWKGEPSLAWRPSPKILCPP